LTRDWDGSIYNYTCMQSQFLPVTDIEPLLERDLVPKYYVVIIIEVTLFIHNYINIGSHYITIFFTFINFTPKLPNDSFGHFCLYQLNVIT